MNFGTATYGKRSGRGVTLRENTLSRVACTNTDQFLIRVIHGAILFYKLQKGAKLHLIQKYIYMS